jgi:hypothetical protein
MKNFNTFPTTWREEDGEIIIDYRPGNGNQPIYPNYEEEISCCVQDDEGNQEVAG